jgi:hypothetical protein
MSLLVVMLRLRLRRDRVQLTVWVLVFFALIAASATEFHTTYGTPAEREAVGQARGLQHLAACWSAAPPRGRAWARSSSSRSWRSPRSWPP